MIRIHRDFKSTRSGLRLKLLNGPETELVFIFFNRALNNQKQLVHGVSHLVYDGLSFIVLCRKRAFCKEFELLLMKRVEQMESHQVYFVSTALDCDLVHKDLCCFDDVKFEQLLLSNGGISF